MMNASCMFAVIADSGVGCLEFATALNAKIGAIGEVGCVLSSRIVWRHTTLSVDRTEDTACNKPSSRCESLDLIFDTDEDASDGFRACRLVSRTVFSRTVYLVRKYFGIYEQHTRSLVDLVVLFVTRSLAEALDVVDAPSLELTRVEARSITCRLRSGVVDCDICDATFGDDQLTSK